MAVQASPTSTSFGEYKVIARVRVLVGNAVHRRLESYAQAERLLNTLLNHTVHNLVHCEIFPIGVFTV